MNFKSKLVLGTVQFGLDYGISNTDGITGENEVNKILKYAWNNNIEIIDTAVAYGIAEDVIGRNMKNSFKVISKFPENIKSLELKDILQKSLAKLRYDCIYAFIAHNAKGLIDNQKMWQSLKSLREQGLTKKIGYSLYTPQELEQLLQQDMVPDLVQVPYNILDNKFEKYFIFLKKQKVEIHVRSIFLQGLFFKEKLPLKLKPLKPAVELLNEIAKKNNLLVGQLALNYVLHHPLIDYAVIGVNKLSHLKQNVNNIQNNFSYDAIRKELESLYIPNRKLLNPVNW